MLACALGCAAPASGQDLGDRAVDAPADAPAEADAPAPSGDQVRFSADRLEYDTEGEVVTAVGEVRMSRAGDRLRADRVTWERRTGRVVATGGVAVANPAGDVAYGESIELTDSLKDGVVQDMLVVLERGGRLAAERGTRSGDGSVLLDRAAYTPCAVVDSEGCPKRPSWQVNAVRIAYRPDRERVYFTRPSLRLFGLPTLPLPSFSTAVGGEGGDNGFLSPDFGYSRANGLEATVPYYLRLAPNRGVTVAPTVFSAVLPMLRAEYRQLDELGSFRIGGYVTASRRSDDLVVQRPTDSDRALRGYVDGLARYQLSPLWSASGSLRVASDRTFLRRYDISRDDRLRSTASLERVDRDSYLSFTGWAVQTLRVADAQGLQPVALPEVDYRRRFGDGLLGGRFEAQLNTLALTRTGGQDTQRAFASLRWDLRRVTTLGQEVTFTGYARADAYNARDVLSTAVESYRGDEGFNGRAIGALAADVRWPFVGPFLGGTQRLVPRLQVVASPKIANLSIPNEDSRAVDLEDSNLFALNRFPGYDRFEDSSRATYGLQWIVNLPGVAIDAVAGQSYRLTRRPAIFFDGTGLSDRFSDIVGRTDVRFRDFVSVIHRYRLDKDSLAVRRNELDATVGTRGTFAQIGYLRLDRNIDPAFEDLRDREEVRAAGRVQFSRFWSAFASAVVDLTDREEDTLSLADGFDPIRHRVGVEYEDDCLRLGATWRRSYRATGDARAGNSFLFTLAFTNLGR